MHRTEKSPELLSKLVVVTVLHRPEVLVGISHQDIERMGLISSLFHVIWEGTRLKAKRCTVLFMACLSNMSGL